MKKEEDSEEEKEEGSSKDDINDMFNTAAEIKSYQLAQERKKFDSYIYYQTIQYIYYYYLYYD